MQGGGTVRRGGEEHLLGHAWIGEASRASRRKEEDGKGAEKLATTL